MHENYMCTLVLNLTCSVMGCCLCRNRMLVELSVEVGHADCALL
jgi:hypothetical protein